jgi:hypothetical protein
MGWACKSIEDLVMPSPTESILFTLAVFVGPLVIHRLAAWYSKKPRYITSAIAIQAVFFFSWLATHPQ